MTEDWVAVATAINQRMSELGLNQRELIARSHVSKAIVHELQHNTAQRRRSDRTLEALSLALDWHPGHLTAVLAGRWPPRVGEPMVRAESDVPSRLAMIEHQLREINDKLDRIGLMNDRLDELNATVEKVAAEVSVESKRLGL